MIKDENINREQLTEEYFTDEEDLKQELEYLYDKRSVVEEDQESLNNSEIKINQQFMDLKIDSHQYFKKFGSAISIKKKHNHK